MRISLILLTWILSITSLVGQQTFYVIDIKEEINKSSAKRLSKGLAEASEMKADWVIIQLNTYGGAVDAADSMRTALLNFHIPVIAFINNQAASAGALISIACDSIYMRKGGSIGAATVVNQTGEVMPDKYQSFMRAMMRATAEVNGRDPKIAEAMVDPSIYIDGLIDSNKVLSFTAEEAMLHGYCEGIAVNTQEVATIITGSDDFILTVQKLSFMDKILLFFLTPVVQGLLLMLIIGGIYFELQSPGIGFPSAAAVIAAVLYFSPLYLEGLAENWEIIIFAIGILLILAEIFVIPGFGVAGVSGIVLMVTGLAFAMIDNKLFYYEGKFDFIVLIKPVSIVMLSTFLSLISSIYLAGKLFKTSRLPGVSLPTELKDSEGFVGVEIHYHHLVGKTAEVKTDMRPSGKIDIDGKWYEATMDMGMANKGDSVIVTRFEAGRLYCERLNQ
ncbi:MAG: serine protease [Bacteroidetes bacterium HGW-Bacteroidetes-6]|nr:MAG: serine protease [Bacteroidetes bacterium HGW-Bacteroidetes-7]PKP04934.1 MAG: serine protease [Bacteroidetes bacterium HGW-Bacteroidetes-6]